jgi:ATP-dependent Clp protease ATP-binding subunit ClpX
MECNFCGKQRSEVAKLIVANDAGICNECIELCHDILDKERMDIIRRDKKVSRALNPNKVKEFLDQYVIGQEQAKMALSVAVVNHYKRVFFKPKVEIDKSNLLMLGPSGSGKTLLAKTVARYLNVPFVIADATTLTQAGYVGEDVESLIGRLLSEAENDVVRCQQGIVFIDEVDKIGRKSESNAQHRDVSGEGVQQALLKMVEGTVCRVTIDGKKRHPAMDTVEIDTTNILFIGAGAFDGLDDIMQQRKHGGGIGFNVNLPSIKNATSEVLPDDMIKFGMIPEFVGRFPLAVKIDELKLEDLARVLIEPKNNLLAQMQFFFESDSIDLQFEDSALLAVAQSAVDLGIGARGLKTVLEKALNPLMFQIPEFKKTGVKRVIITEDVITTHAPPTLEKHEKLQN